MLSIMLYSLITIFSLIFTQMSHPLSMGLLLLIQTILICMVTGLISPTFWFSYILFLVFLGGMLVLFIYVTSLASNEMFTLSMNLTMIFMLLFISLTLLTFLFDWMMINPILFNKEINSISYNMNMEENKIMLMKLYNYPTNLITIMLISYLLITLVAIVKITNIFYGPLRPMN